MLESLVLQFVEFHVGTVSISCSCQSSKQIAKPTFIRGDRITFSRGPSANKSLGLAEFLSLSESCLRIRSSHMVKLHQKIY